MTAFWSALVTPGLAPPAAQPQIELTTISVVPGMVRAASTSAAALSGVTPHCESSSHIGRTASGSYKGCILIPPFCSCTLCGALAKHAFLLVPRRDHTSLISITMRATFGYFILWNCAIKGANRLPAALGWAFVTRNPLFFSSPTGFTLPVRLISRRPAGIKQKNSGSSQVMMTFDLAQDYNSRALCMVGLIASRDNVLVTWSLAAPRQKHG